jgi:hypothetical protein
VGKEISTQELSKLHIGSNGASVEELGSLKGKKSQKQMALELLDATAKHIAGLSVQVKTGKLERKAILKKFRQTNVGMQLTLVEDETKKAAKDLKELTARYAGMIEAVGKLGIDIDMKQIKRIGE